MLRRFGSGDGSATLVQTGQTRRAHQAVADDIVWHVTGWIARFTVAALVLARISVDRAVPAELSHVVAAQNRFMSRLSTNIGAPRAFIAEAAHQIPNPLASLCAQAQTATDSRSALPPPTPAPAPAWTPSSAWSSPKAAASNWRARAAAGWKRACVCPRMRHEAAALRSRGETVLGRVALQDPRDSTVAYFIVAQDARLLCQDSAPLQAALGA